MRALPLLMILLAVGCTRTVHPPVAVQEPEKVWLVENGRHGSVVIRNEVGNLVQFDYGEFAWYANQRGGWYRMPAVILWPTDGALARREVPVVDDPDITTVRRVLMGEHVWSFLVERSRARALLQSLDFRYRQERATETYDPRIDTWFVVDPDPYHAFRTCNHVLADWLVSLGCRVSGDYWSWDWDVEGALEVAP